METTDKKNLATIEDVQKIEKLWRNKGIDSEHPKSAPWTIQDAISMHNASTLLPKVITNIVREAIEPILTLTPLLTRINYSVGQTITYGAIGAFEASDIGESGEYKEQSIDTASGSKTCTIGKSGLAVKVSEEMIRYSQFDLIGLMLRAAGRALARWKEVKVANMILNAGTVAFDNTNPTSSIKGPTTGRALNGTGNGSMIMDDIFDMFAILMTQGFVPNCMIVHPLMWVAFIKDPIMRAFALASGGGSFFQGWQGNVNQQAWQSAIQGGIGGTAGQAIIPGGNSASLTPSALTEYNPQMNSAPSIPSYFGFPFRMVVSPFVRFDVDNMLTDVILCDANELGALVVDEEVTTEEWTDPKNDMTKIKLRERYSMFQLHDGLQTVVAKNVKVTANELVLPAQATIDVSGSNLATLSATTAVV
jgi:hypothetical protein